jgi:replicative DNA helicase
MNQRQAEISDYLFGKLPAQALPLEEVVLGALMLDKDAIHTVIDILMPECFYTKEHQLIYSALLRLFEKSRPIDVLTVTEELKKSGDLDAVGGGYALVDLTNRVGSSANIEYHALIIREKWVQRSLGELGMKLVKESFDETSSVTEMMSDAEKKIFEVSVGNTKKQAENAPSILTKTLANIEKATKSKDGLTGVPCGLTTLDRMTGGWQNSDLIGLAARPSQGKSALAAQLMVDAAKLGHPTAFFSLEMSSTQLMNRILSAEAGMDGKKLMRGRLEDYEWQQLHSAAERIGELPFFIDETPALSITEARSKCMKLKMQHGIKLFIFDYLQLMVGDQRKGVSRDREVASISAALKSIAKELNVPVIALSQLSRASEQRGGSKRPMLSDLRDSGCLAGDTMIYSPAHGSDRKMVDLVWQTGFDVVSLDNTSMRTTTARKCFSTGRKMLYEMTLINGQSVLATDNHKFLTEDGWLPLSGCSGKRVAVPLGLGGATDIPDSHVALVGHFLANGCAIAGRPLRVTLNANDIDLADIIGRDVVEATKGGVTPKTTHTNIPGRSQWNTMTFIPTRRVTHGVTSPLKDLLKHYGVFDFRAGEKRIPDQMFYMPDEKAAIMLRAMFSGDGCACVTGAGNRLGLKITYSSKSRLLVFGVQRLLLQLGITSFVNKVTNQVGHSWYNLAIGSKECRGIFVQKVGFLSERKREVMLRGWAIESAKSGGWKKYSFNKERTLCYMPVRSIVATTEEAVFDIEVPGTHNFVANGILAHNSIEQDLDICMFIHRPEYYGVMEDEDGNSTQGKAEIIFAKHRNGSVGTVELRFEKELTMFSDISDFPAALSAPAKSFYETEPAPPSILTTPSKMNDDKDVPF